MQIKIWQTDQDDGGWMYDIYLDEDADTNEADSDDGGFCTGSKVDAVQMACEQAIELLKLAPRK